MENGVEARQRNDFNFEDLDKVRVPGKLKAQNIREVEILLYKQCSEKQNTFLFTHVVHVYAIIVVITIMNINCLCVYKYWSSF